jgi:predicted HD superfamily hydrolase involved in NAD metabolism
MKITEEIFKYQEIVKKEITSSRYEHSIRVAEIAYELALCNGLENPKDAYLSGVLHDITKQKLNSFHETIFQKAKFDFSDLPTPAYHPFSAYFYLQETYQFTNFSVLSAIKNHTLGGTNLPILDKILYVSDFLGSEYATRSSDFDFWMKNTKKNLHFGILLKTKSTMIELMEKNLEIHKKTYEFYNETICLISNHSIS